jgi:hypothetical protein
MSEITGQRPFGFTVRRYRTYTGGWQPDGPRQPVEVHLTEPPVWTVSLPHQCDAWVIAGKEWDSDPDVSQTEAIAALERFIAEAQHALDELRAGREVAGDDLKEDWDEEHK